MLAAVSANAYPGGSRRRAAAGRTVAVLALAVAATLAVTGCGKFDQALGQQEEVVIFQPNVPNAVKLKVRAACSHVPNVKVEPLPTDHKLSDEIYDVRYEVGSASTVELAQLTQCLSKYPSSIIQGLETDTPGGDD
jgi:hypothetical protein